MTSCFRASRNSATRRWHVSKSINAVFLTVKRHLHYTLLTFTTMPRPLKRGYARNALRKKKYASKIKSTQETQKNQENYARKKQKYVGASHATDANGPCVRKRNDRTDSIFQAKNASGRSSQSSALPRRPRCRIVPGAQERNGQLPYRPTLGLPTGTGGQIGLGL